MNDDDPVIAYLRTVQIWRLRDAKEAAQTLIGISEQLIKKIDAEGYNGYYSANHDSLDKAQKIHRACNDLFRFRMIMEKIDKIKKIEMIPTPSGSVEKPKTKSVKKKD
jgi:capsule polysaccharide export protein KpsE/RkpR